MFQPTAYSSRTVLIIGGLKQLPRLRQVRNGAIFLWRSHPFFAKKGITELNLASLVHYFAGEDQDHGAIAHGGFANHDLLAFFDVERGADIQSLRLAIHSNYR